MTRTALVMAGGTGGHIFPGLALAQVLRQQGWRVHWLGAPAPSMESQLVPAQGFAYETVRFGGVRGKGAMTLLWLPMRLLHAFWQSLQIIRQLKPNVLIGFGGYITFPGAMMGVLCGKPLVLHEQNAVAGTANKILAHLADRVMSNFPSVLPKTQWVGNPLRDSFINCPAPVDRFASREGPLRIVVVGGSLGAQVLNETVPKALAMLPQANRPMVFHQGGAKHLEALQAHYEAAGVEAELVSFIDDTAAAFAQADLVICRAGASTVSELAAIGVAALMVPFPHAVDDHQTANAKFLTEQGAGWLMPQVQFNPASLSAFIQSMSRPQLAQVAINAYALRKTQAAHEMARACEEVSA